MNEIKTILATKIKKAIQSRHIQYNEFAEMIGCHYNNITNWTKGAFFPRLPLQKKLVQTLEEYDKKYHLHNTFKLTISDFDAYNKLKTLTIKNKK